MHQKLEDPKILLAEIRAGVRVDSAQTWPETLLVHVLVQDLLGSVNATPGTVNAGAGPPCHQASPAEPRPILGHLPDLAKEVLNPLHWLRFDALLNCFVLDHLGAHLDDRLPGPSSPDFALPTRELFSPVFRIRHAQTLKHFADTKIGIAHETSAGRYGQERSRQVMRAGIASVRPTP